ncbi:MULTISPECIES: riboflavin synthase [unclassified Crossiella]|uniref:riboflavin synthase n=1 Tax=unclassified Crossiella TaxID=2620835 RepID=UPI00200018A6|nr:MULTISPECIES: riboflavin synthase [unclassified Crossiella]MCK2245488.1 riboflavin synthase [Crossiella sp. S99.2]MCK2259132.1 riboflavin synthase [Crossiella sp. S99.1]
MFTGIVEERGHLVAVEQLTDAARITVAGPLVTSDAKHGDSIAVNGVCLTVVEAVDGTFTADVMRETLQRSNLGKAAAGDPVNLERAAALGQRLGGHIMQGHVDGTGSIAAREPSEHWEIVRVSIPPALSRYLVEKGSVAIDGVSLTVVEVGADYFTVSLIPTTLDLTTLGIRQPGDQVNLEVDVLAKYVEKLASGAIEAATKETR